MVFSYFVLQARRGGVDEPFAWESREFLRKLCIGKVMVLALAFDVIPAGGNCDVKVRCSWFGMPYVTFPSLYRK